MANKQSVATTEATGLNMALVSMMTKDAKRILKNVDGNRDVAFGVLLNNTMVNNRLLKDTVAEDRAIHYVNTALKLAINDAGLDYHVDGNI